MGLENLVTYTESMIGWFSFALILSVVIAVVVIGYQWDRIRKLERQVDDLWRWAEMSDEDIMGLHKKIDSRF